MPSKSEAVQENWVGQKFANNWLILKKLSCAEYKKIYTENTGDTSKIIKNTHYLCQNKTCGITTYIERTVIQRAMKANRDYLSKCAGCSGNRENCHYSIQCREKNLYKIPDRSEKAKDGDVIGTWTILSILPSENDSGHRKQTICRCNLCGKEKQISLNQVLLGNAACECFKSHSAGEATIKTFLDDNNILYKTEYTFDNLAGTGGGLLRYDFAIFNTSNNIVGLIEYDGEQHFQEAGSYFNKDGHVQIHDNIKNKFALDKNIPLLRIPYTDFLNINNLLIDFFKKI